jgi:hypothetical protein
MHALMRHHAVFGFEIHSFAVRSLVILPSVISSTDARLARNVLQSSYVSWGPMVRRAQLEERTLSRSRAGLGAALSSADVSDVSLGVT